jgi:outer membrane protein assembly complex protein YaeT
MLITHGLSVIEIGMVGFKIFHSTVQHALVRVTCRVVLLLFLCAYGSRTALAVFLNDLDPTREWRVKTISISGAQLFSERELLTVILTKQRPWHLVWKEYPLFDSVTFTTDIQRLEHFYEARGYYKRKINYSLDTDDAESLITIHITIEENAPVTITNVSIMQPPATAETPPVALPPQLPVKLGTIFTEAAYQEEEQLIRDFLLERGHAYVETQRKATVDLADDSALVEYTVTPGPVTVFGETRVEGTKDVNPDLVLRELAYKPGEPFSLKKIAESEQKVRDLELFRAVNIAPDRVEDKPSVVPMHVRVEEKPRHAIKLGVKYSTRDEIGAQAEWNNRNVFGDGRQFSVLLQLASVNRRLNVSFIQPHFLTPNTRFLVNLRQEQSDEETFLLNASRFLPRIEHRFSSQLSGFVGYRLEYDKLNSISPATIRALGGITRGGILSGPSLGLIWNTAEDPFDPREGTVLSLLADQAGVFWGGDFQFYKIIGEAKRYQPIGWQTTFASRIKLGLVDTLGSKTDVPLFERLYAGGEKSVRGYGRRRLGPLSTSDDPLGGRSLIEGSLELRRPVWKQLGGALFLDFGQLSLNSLDFPVDDLDFAAGFGVWYPTAVGPLRLDIGFPFKPPHGDQFWQLHFSIGQFF